MRRWRRRQINSFGRRSRTGSDLIRNEVLQIYSRRVAFRLSRYCGYRTAIPGLDPDRFRYVAGAADPVRQGARFRKDKVPAGRHAVAAPARAPAEPPEPKCNHVTARDSAVDVAAPERAARDKGVPLKVLDVERPATATFGGVLRLSRPDQHEAWRGNRLPADPLALINRVRGDSNRTSRPAASDRSGAIQPEP
jgi:hypothetical protein